MNNQILIACLSTYPPRQCGIATFSEALVTAYNNLYLPEAEMRVVAMQAPGARLGYSKNVLGVIDQEKPKSYIAAARKLNSNARVKLVTIQHEFGIFGGIWGQYLELFLKKITKPVVVTLHTVLPNPQPVVLERITALGAFVSGIIVMTNRSKQILMSNYNIPEHKITIIPHGIYPQRYNSPRDTKTKLSLPQVPILSTFGLLSKNKGIEYVIKSLPAVIKKFPKLRYLVLGKTHPVVKKAEGEIYRERLLSLVKSLKLGGHVSLINKYFPTLELLSYLQATDVYLSSSLDPNQAVSGTLSYALGAGRPVISTKFPQAQEDITPEVGALVPFQDSKAISKALIRLLSHKETLTRMGKNAYFKTRHTTWPNVALASAKYFSRFAPVLARQYKNLPPIKLGHIKSLTDNFGIFQFAHLHIPDPRHGYTLDDNARALLALTSHYKKFKQRKVLPLMGTYLKFIAGAATGDGAFHNYFTADRKIDFYSNSHDSLEDANARCLYALMAVSASPFLPKDLRLKAQKLYQPSFFREFTSPRSAAFYVKGLFSLRKQARAREAIQKHCDFLVDRYKQSRTPKWQWFERQLTYSNALLPEALLLGFLATGKKQYFSIGKKTLDFLISQTFIDGMYMAIGQDGWYEQGGRRAEFDQQPEDPAAMVQALKTMRAVTGQKKYGDLMHTAFYWFLGDNVLGQFVYDTVTGGCYDGIGRQKTNLNQGAESSLSYLLARLAVAEN